MTTIPAALTTSSPIEAIELTLQRLWGRDLTVREAETDLLLLFDADAAPGQREDLKQYVSDLSARVVTGDLEPADAASDIQQIMQYWITNSADLPELLHLGYE
ncbi:MAG: hypothetical protein QM647_18425 [Asticcacaulis sp.]|uniref:hypothetical protein n=1 Tax=Asticcacaulis sp. TaxID=1872648 RepID=UPI0039E536F7